MVPIIYLFLAITLLSGCTAADWDALMFGNLYGQQNYYQQQQIGGVCEFCRGVFVMTPETVSSYQNVQCPFCQHEQNIQLAINRYSYAAQQQQQANQLLEIVTNASTQKTQTLQEPVNNVISSTNNGWQQAASHDELKYNSLQNTWSYEDPKAAPKYNSFSNKWEMATPDEQLKYNSFQNTWSYEPSNATTKYNSSSNKWEMATPNEQLKYNSFSNSWSYEDPKAAPKYNPFTGTYEQAK